MFPRAPFVNHKTSTTHILVPFCTSFWFKKKYYFFPLNQKGPLMENNLKNPAIFAQNKCLDVVTTTQQKQNSCWFDCQRGPKKRALFTVFLPLENTLLYPYWDKRRDVRSNIPLRLKEFPSAKPKGTPEGEGVYLSVYPESSPNTDNISF